MDPRDPGDEKVTPLFRRPTHGDENTPKSNDMPPAMKAQLDALFGGPEPLPKFVPPDPTHRNARACPQCDALTWAATKECIYCGYDIVEHDVSVRVEEARLAEIERRRALKATQLKFARIIVPCVFGFLLFMSLAASGPEVTRVPTAIACALCFIAAWLLMMLMPRE